MTNYSISNYNSAADWLISVEFCVKKQFWQGHRYLHST